MHFVRNALSLCGVAQRPLVLRLMQTVTEAPTREAARTALAAAVAELEKKSPKVARLLRKDTSGLVEGKSVADKDGEKAIKCKIVQLHEIADRA